VTVTVQGAGEGAEHSNNPHLLHINIIFRPKRGRKMNCGVSLQSLLSTLTQRVLARVLKSASGLLVQKHLCITFSLASRFVEEKPSRKSQA